MRCPDLETDLRTLLREVNGRWAGVGEVPSEPVTGISTDSRNLERGEVFFALNGERFDGHDFVRAAVESGAAACLVRKERVEALSGPLIAVDDPLEALENLAVWRRRSLSFEVTAITGSVGKTTTKEFLRALLRRRHRVRAAPKSFNNRLGVALTMLSAASDTEHLVVEMGTSAPGEISHLARLVRPERAVVTQVAAAHLSGLKDLDGVIAAKAEILDGLSPEGVSYLNANMKGFELFACRAPGPVRTFGWRRGDFAVRDCRPRGGLRRGALGRERPGYIFEIQGREFELPVLGSHNVSNAAAAVAVARDLGSSWDDIRDGLMECRLPPGRLEGRPEGGILLVDDSYNANPGSVASAIDALAELALGGGKRVAVLGDMLELGEQSRCLHEGVGRLLAAVPIDLVVTIGSESRWIARAFADELRHRGCGQGRESRHFHGATEALEFVRERLGEGDAVLLKGSNRSGIRDVVEELRRWVRTRTSAT